MNIATKLLCLAGMSVATAVFAPSIYADDYAATGNPADLNVTEAIKMKLDGDTTLSRDARSIQVITTDNAVILRGTVTSQGESDKIQRYAEAYAGDHQLHNELTISGR